MQSMLVTYLRPFDLPSMTNIKKIRNQNHQLEKLAGLLVKNLMTLPGFSGIV